MFACAWKTDCLRIVLTGVAGCLLLGNLSASRADVFKLRAGGQVEGKLVERGPQGEYVVQTELGAQLTFSKKQVRKHKIADALQNEYVAKSRAMPDTLEAHRELVVWCREQRFKKLVDLHLQRILQLDPEDELARRGLGFQKVNGKWLTRDQIMAERGLTFFDRAYRTPQDIALRQRTENRKQAESEWHRKIKLWRSWLYGRRESRAAEASNQIAAIDDPAATPAIVKFLHDEDDPHIRDLLIDTLAKLKHSLAVQTLVALSMEDPDPEVRIVCIEHLLKTDRPLSLTPYISALTDSKNQRVNRAGEALGTIGNAEAISPLIDALITAHKYSTGAGSSDQINTSFSNQGGGGGGGGGGGFSYGGGGPKVVRRDQQNREVHRALAKLSGQDFQYNRRAWRRWFVNNQSRDQVNSRRDE